MTGLRVALVSMPFVSVQRPSMQLGLLKGIVQAAGFEADTLHLNLELAARVGVPLYERLCDHRGPLIGEWLYSRAAFGDEAPDPDHRFLRDFLGRYEHIFGDGERARAGLRWLRDEVIPSSLAHLMATEDWGRYDVVGFSSTFQQHVASLALARRIKAMHPRTHVVIGGANVDGAMGPAHLEGAPWIDQVVVGEGDDALPELLRALAAGGDGGGVPGVATRRDGRVRMTAPRAPRATMDDLPVPDYDEYFARGRALGVLPEASLPGPHIPIETARGCWWGEKHHCTFCGLNGATMKYRAKSPARVRAELAELSRRYGSFHFEAVDNILATEYLGTLLPELAQEATSYALFYEVKANMGRDQVRLLYESGVHAVQPGIESLSTHVLELMHKGTTALQNVNFLRWCRHYGVSANWNLLWGFPGETPEDYRAQVELARQLTHLQPPVGAFRVWLERFSPLYEARARHADPAQRPRAERSYRYVYPAHYDHDTIAYFFEDARDPDPSDADYEPTRQVVLSWQAAWQGAAAPSLSYWASPSLLHLDDRRADVPIRYAFADGDAAVYLAAIDRPLTRAALHRAVRERALSATEVDTAIDRYVALGLMAADGERVLALALPAYVGAEGQPRSTPRVLPVLP